VGGEGCGVEVVGTVGKGIRDSQGAQKLAPSAMGMSASATFYHTGVSTG
jgi:hypothetical protein